MKSADDSNVWTLKLPNKSLRASAACVSGYYVYACDKQALSNWSKAFFFSLTTSLTKSVEWFLQHSVLQQPNMLKLLKIQI